MERHLPRSTCMPEDAQVVSKNRSDLRALCQWGLQTGKHGGSLDLTRSLEYHSIPKVIVNLTALKDLEEGYSELAEILCIYNGP